MISIFLFMCFFFAVVAFSTSDGKGAQELFITGFLGAAGALMGCFVFLVASAISVIALLYLFTRLGY